MGERPAEPTEVPGRPDLTTSNPVKIPGSPKVPPVSPAPASPGVPRFYCGDDGVPAGGSPWMSPLSAAPKDDPHGDPLEGASAMEDIDAKEPPVGEAAAELLSLDRLPVLDRSLRSRLLSILWASWEVRSPGRGIYLVPPAPLALNGSFRACSARTACGTCFSDSLSCCVSAPMTS